MRNRESDNGIDVSWAAEYSKEYLHFDKIIWQLPAFSSAIFAGTIASFASVLSKEASPIIGNLLLLVVSIIFCVNYYTLYRLRVHQRHCYRFNAPIPPKPNWFGAQLCLQFGTGTLTLAIIFLLINRLMQGVFVFAGISDGMLINIFLFIPNFCMAGLFILSIVFIELNLRQHSSDVDKEKTKEPKKE